MRKILAVLVLVGALVVPATTATASEVSTTPTAVEQEVNVEIGGAYGPQWCYVFIDYFYVTPTIQSRPPYLTIDSGGSLGAEVHCPLPPLGNWT